MQTKNTKANAILKTKPITCNFKTTKSYVQYLEKWVQQTIHNAGAKGVVFGLSGGIDSAVIAAIAKSVFKNNHLAVVMHINNPLLDKECTDQAIKDLKLNAIHLDLLDAATNIAKTIKINPKKDLEIFGNIKARIRAVSLYGLAQKHNYLVLGTSNYDEWMTGYFTKYGDSACDIAPLRNLLKGDVYTLGNYYQVPQIILQRAPSAGLKPNQTDENDLNLKYVDLDNHFLRISPFKKTELEHYNKMHKNSIHKRTLPLAPKGIHKLV